MRAETLRAGVLALLLAAAPSGRAAVPDDIKALIEQGKPREAYELGLKHDDLSGEPLFDYYFGIAAVQAGRVAAGVLALERVLMSNPENSIARLELGLAYFTLGDDQRAMEEFMAVLVRKPPPGVVATVEKFVDAIRAREGRYRTKWTGNVEAGLGRNSNVNYSPLSSIMVIPALGLLVPELATTPVDLGVTRKPSVFRDLGGNVQVVTPLTGNMQAFGAANGLVRGNAHVEGFDQRLLGGTGGLLMDVEGHKFRLAGSYAQSDLDGKRYRTATGLGGDWSGSFSKGWTWRSSVAQNAFRYAGESEVRDSDMLALGGGATVEIGGPYEIALAGDLNYADERNLKNRPDLGRGILGARLQAGMMPRKGLSVIVGGSIAQSRYRGPDPLFLATRDDTLRTFDISASSQFSRTLSVRVEWSVVSNRSNIPLYSSDQRILAMRLRHEWK